MLDTNGQLKDLTEWMDRTIAAICACTNESCQPDQQLGLALEGTAQTCFQAEGKTLKVLSSKRQATAVGHKTLAKCWGISLRTAERTLQSTTHRGIRTILHPTLSRRFRTNGCQLQYH